MNRSAVVGVMVAALSGAAFAQSSTAQASLSGYSYELIDLDPNDGIAPSITFSNVLQGAVVSVTPTGGQTTENTQWSENGAPVSAQLGQPGADAAAWFSVDELKATSTADNAGYYHAIAGWDADYTLSAHTKLVVTGQAAGSLDVDGTVTQQVALAMVSVLFRAPAQSPHDDPSNLASYSRSVLSLDPASGTSFDEAFEVVLVNDSASALSATMSVVARSTAAGVSPIPEPATYLMLGAGLALTGAMARRRRLSGAN